MAFKYTAMIDVMRFYGLRLSLVFVAIATADSVCGQADCFWRHFAIFLLIWVAACVIHYLDWFFNPGGPKRSYAFSAAADDEGVTTSQRRAWSAFDRIQETEDVVLFHGNDGLTLVPNTSEYRDLIAFSRKHIEAK